MKRNKKQEDILYEKAFNAGISYQEKLENRHVTPSEDDLKLLKRFDEIFPDLQGDALEIIAQLDMLGSPNTVTQTGGRYFGFVNGATYPVGLAARVLADFWDQNSALEVMSPIVSHLETVVEKWLVDLFGLPEETAVSFVSGTSMSSFCGLAAARWKILKNNGWDINKKGFIGAPQIKVIMGEDGHASVIKALHLLGIGDDQIIKVPCDDQGRFMPGDTPQIDSLTICILQAGNVNSGAFDPFVETCEKANKYGAWVHVDGAFGLWAAGSRSFSHLTKGVHLADSWSVDAHKTLNTPYDSGILLCRDRDALLNAMYASGAYIIGGDKRDGMYYTPEMSRRGRIIELWATLKYLGREGIDNLLNQLHERARQIAQLLEENDFEILNEVVFNQVLVRYKDDESTEKILKFIQNDRKCWCGPSVWKGKKVIRISVCSWRTDADDIKTSAESFIRAKEALIR